MEHKEEYQTDFPVDNAEVQEKTSTYTAQRANDLNGSTWTKYSISIWSDIRKTKEEAELRHPAMFPIALVTRIIQCFTNKDDEVVLDPFAGVGSTVIAAEALGRTGIGIEISPEYAEKAKERPCIQDMFYDGKLGERRIYTADARMLLSLVERDSVDLVVTSPPYWDILLQKRTADNKEIRNYGDEPEDLGKIRDYEKFLKALSEIFRLVYDVMKPGKYCCMW